MVRYLKKVTGLEKKYFEILFDFQIQVRIDENLSIMIMPKK